MIESVGFTGSSEVMTQQQLIMVHQLLGEFKEKGASFAHHGMCVEADAKFDFMADAMGYEVTGHPGVRKDGSVYKRMTGCRARDVRPPYPFLKRNRYIVAESDVMVACPKEYEMQFIGSGTWATIRYAREALKPLFIVYPNGRMEIERADKVFPPEYVAYLTGIHDP